MYFLECRYTITSFVIAYNLDGRVRNKKKVILHNKIYIFVKGTVSVIIFQVTLHAKMAMCN